MEALNELDWAEVKRTYPSTYKTFNPSTVKTLSDALTILDEECVVLVVDYNHYNREDEEWFFRCYDTVREIGYNSQPLCMYYNRHDATIEGLMYALGALEERRVSFTGK